MSRAAHHHGAQAGHGHGRLPDDGAHGQPRRPGRAGQADGRLRRQLHLHHRLGRLHAARRRQGATAAPCVPRSSPRPNSASTATTTWPWASPTRSPPSRAAPTASMPPPRAWAPAPATRRWKCFVAVCDRMGIETGVDVFKIQDVAEDLVVPMMDSPDPHRPRRPDAGLRRRLFHLPAVRQARREEVRRVRPATSWSNWAAAAWSAARKT